MLGSTEKILKDKNSENVSRLEINEVVLVPCNLVNKTYQHDSRVLHTFILNKPIGNYWRFHQQISYFYRDFIY